MVRHRGILAVSAGLLAVQSAAVASPTATRTAACNNLPTPVAPGVEILSVVGAEIYNVTGDVELEGSSSERFVTGLNICNVNITLTHPGVNDTVLVEIWLPLEGWTGRFQGLGGGGFATGYLGITTMGAAVARGHVAATTDAGNISLDSGLYANPNMVSNGKLDLGRFGDYASRGLHEMTVIGKAITTSYYGQAPHHSYWAGCSNGGREGHLMAQKYPNDYDGILANAPAIYWNSVSLTSQYPQLIMHEVDYVPSQCEFQYVQNQSIIACDALDGVLDGVISDPSSCNFDPTTLVGHQISCDGVQANITSALAEIVQKMHDGPPGAFGSNLWYGYTWGTGYTLVANTEEVNGTMTGVPFGVSDTWFSTFILKNPSFNMSTLTYQDYIELTVASWNQLGGIFGTADPNLGPFRDGGGKLLTWHGLADGIIPTNGTLHYRSQVEGFFGGADIVDEFYRLFLAPGVSHCGGGYGPTPDDPLAALIAWVEQDQAPEVLPASFVDLSGVNATRNICLYPQVARYDGTNDVNLASSYSCQASY